MMCLCGAWQVDELGAWECE